MSRILYPCDRNNLVSECQWFFFQALAGCNGVDQFRYLLQRRTILQIVSQECALPCLASGGLPMHPPCHALDSRSSRLGPRAAQAAAYVLQAVRVGGEIDVGVDERKSVDEPI